MTYIYQIRHVGAPMGCGGYEVVSEHDSLSAMDQAWSAGGFGNLAYDYACIVTDGHHEWTLAECPDEALGL